MSLPAGPSGTPEHEKLLDRIPEGEFCAPQRLEEFIAWLEQKTLEYVNEVCGNVILDDSEKHWVHQSRLRKFVAQGNSAMRNPEKTFCIPSLIDRKKAEGWGIHRIQHYIELAALTGQVPTDSDNRYHSGFENQLGNYLIKAQYYQQRDTIAEYDELWRNGWHIYENIALQIPCLETDILPPGYSIALATAEEDAHQKIDFFLKNDETGEKIGVQFTIDRTRVDSKMKAVRASRKDMGQTVAILAITPGGIHRNISDLMMSDYKQKQDILFAERLKRNIPDNYRIFCNQLRQAFQRIVLLDPIEDVATGVIVRVIPGTSSEAQKDTWFVEATVPEESTNIDVDSTIKKEDLPHNMQSTSGFEWAWREFLQKLNASFHDLLVAQPTTDSNRTDITNDWKRTKYSYDPSESFEECMDSFTRAMNDFMQGGDNKEYKKRRVGNFQDLMETLLWARATKALFPVTNFTVNTKTVMRCHIELSQSKSLPQESLTFFQEQIAWIENEVGIWNTFINNPARESLDSVQTSTKKIIEIVRSMSTAANKYVIEQYIEQHLNEADIWTAFADPNLIACLVPEINALLMLTYEGSGINTPQIEISDSFDTTVLVPQVNDSVVEILETPAPVAPPAEIVKTDPKIRLQEKIDEARKIIQHVQSQIEALTRGTQDAASELWIFQSEKSRIEKDLADASGQISETRKNFITQLSSSAHEKVQSPNFYKDMADMVQTSGRAENKLSETIKKLQQKLSECERSIKRGEERLAQAQKDMQTARTRLEQEKIAAEADKVKFESTLKVLIELD